MAGHVHMMMSIPPKYAVAQVIGFIKGKSAIQIAGNFIGRKKKKFNPSGESPSVRAWRFIFVGQRFWAGYHVSTIGRDEEAIRKYIKKQEEDRRVDQINFFDE